MPIIDIHTHCAPRITGDPFGLADMLRGVRVGRTTVTNFRGLPAISPDDMVWYTDYARGFLGRLDPTTGKVTEWPSPSGPKSGRATSEAQDKAASWYPGSRVAASMARTIPSISVVSESEMKTGALENRCGRVPMKVA